MSQKGISFRLNSHVTAFAVIIISLVVYINYHFSNKILIGKIEEGAINQSNLIISKISRITVGTEEIARNVSYQALYYHRHNDLQIFLSQVVMSNPTIEGIHVELFNDDGDIYSVCHSSKNCENSYRRESGIFPIDSVTLDDPVWSKPFYCARDTAQLLVGYRIPIFFPESKTLAGVVICEISLKKIREMLSRVQIGEKGYSFVIDSLGNYITHPKEEWVLNKNLFLNPPVIFDGQSKEIEAKIKSGKVGMGYGATEYLNNQNAWFYFAPLPSSKWTVIIVIPEKELFDKIDSIFQIIVLVSGLGILLLFVMNMLIFRRILNPLAEITYAIQRFSTLPGKEQKSKDEIKMLTDSFADWQTKYGSLIKEKNKTDSEKQKIEKDLRSARDIQLSIIPDGRPRFLNHPEIDLYATLKPAETVGGDLYDYFFIDDYHLLVAIGDVSGKGIPAALFMAVVTTLIKSNAKMLSAKDIVNQVNNELSDKNSNQYFVTLFVAIIDVRSGMMDYCNAAHNYPYIIHSGGDVYALTKSHGLPLGIYKNKTYRSNSVQLKHDDVLLLYTDGVINAMDSNNQHYGVEKLEKNLNNLIDLTAEETVVKLIKSVSIYEGDSKQADDITLVAVKYIPKVKTQD